MRPVNVPACPVTGRVTGADTPLVPPQAAPVAPVRVLVVYDDLRAGRRAMDLVGQLAVNSGGNVDFQPAFWRLDVLGEAGCREAADGDADAAEMIVIGLSCAERSSRIDGWLEQALARREASSVAVVAILPETAPRDAGADARLGVIAQIAGRHGDVFFVSEPSRESTAEPGNILRR